MTEAILIGLTCVLSYFIGVFQTRLFERNETSRKQSDSILRANAARDAIRNGDKSEIESDVFNRDGK